MLLPLRISQERRGQWPCARELPAQKRRPLRLGQISVAELDAGLFEQLADGEGVDVRVLAQVQCAR